MSFLKPRYLALFILAIAIAAAIFFDPHISPAIVLASTPILALDTRVEMQSTLGTPKTITNITNAAPPVVSSTAHGFLDGQIVVLSVDGMRDLDARACRVANKTTDTFELEGLDATDMGTFVSGTATQVTAFLSFDNITTINKPEPQPNTQDATTVHDKTRRELFGLNDPQKITMNCSAEPMNATMIAVRTASTERTARVFRFTTQTGLVLITNAFVAGGRGFDAAAGAIFTGQIFLSYACADDQFFAS